MAGRPRRCAECGVVYVSRKSQQTHCSRACGAKGASRKRVSPERDSAKTLAVLRFVVAYVGNNHYSPAVRDIQAGLGISSTSVVAYHLDALQKRGLIRRTPHVSRSIVLLPAAHEALR